MRAVLGFSGGVDSTTMAAILAPAMGDRLLGVCIDGGHLREDELVEVRRHASAAGINLEVVDAEEEFLEALRGVTDAEEKRHIFKRIYLRLLKEAAARFGATHVVQGTLATDEIESGATGGHLIKSHHNVDLDWEYLGELKPLSPFFKYEVRALSEELRLPDTVTNREPFPGPGLFLRCLGGEVTAERLDLVRWSDHQVREILRKAKDVPEISQLVVGLCCVHTTGVKGDGRAYGPAIVVRAVHTTDYMTAEAVEFPLEVRRLITGTLTRNHGVVRVWFDEVPKPPATTEFE
jgi:GMP synthase (glutamine-hydrolysing)